MLAVQNSDKLIYTWSLYFPFEPLEKCMTSEDIFPGLSRTKVILQTLQVLESSRKKIQDFPEAWEPCREVVVNIQNATISVKQRERR